MSEYDHWFLEMHAAALYAASAALFVRRSQIMAYILGRGVA